MGKLFKILVWGKTGVGKTTIIEQLAYGRTEERVRIFIDKNSFSSITFIGLALS